VEISRRRPATSTCTDPSAPRRSAARHRNPERRSIRAKPAELLELAKEQDSSASPELQKLRDIYGDWELRFGSGSSFFAPLLARADVVAATCVGLAGVRGSLEVPFDLCILDEASKATPTEALVPMGRSRRWILVGDPAQLPPFLEREVQTTEAFRKAGLNKNDLQQTIFDMAIRELPDEAVIRLNEQFRMVPAIGKLVAECFYPGQGLKSAPREDSPAVTLALGQPVTWLDTSGLERRRENAAKGTSFTNLSEAVAVRDLAAKLQFVAGNRRERIGVAVLTGYDPQRELLRRELGQAGLTNLDWGTYTIDEFQGREADVAIVSLTRSNTRKSMGFLNDPRRLNVAISRGRFGLVIVGDAQFCRSLDADTPARRILDYIEGTDGCALTPVGATR
jgi:superfamily I DNA and/or RNA helicase